jgi:cell division protein FtsL
MKSNLNKKTSYYNQSSAALDLDSWEDLQANHISLVEPSYAPDYSAENEELRVKQQFRVFSSSAKQRSNSQFAKLQKALTSMALVGFLGAGLSYFFLISVEFEVSKNINKLDKQMKVREDLKSYLGKTYSWSNLSKSAKTNHLAHAKNIEIAETNSSYAHSLFDITEEI